MFIDAKHDTILWRNIVVHKMLDTVIQFLLNKNKRNKKNKNKNLLKVNRIQYYDHARPFTLAPNSNALSKHYYTYLIGYPDLNVDGLFKEMDSIKYSYYFSFQAKADDRYRCELGANSTFSTVCRTHIRPCNHFCWVVELLCWIHYITTCAYVWIAPLGRLYLWPPKNIHSLAKECVMWGMPFWIIYKWIRNEAPQEQPYMYLGMFGVWLRWSRVECGI